MEILVLGPIAARVDGREVPIGGPRQRRLLAALVRAEGRVVSTGQLADAVWADEATLRRLRSGRCSRTCPACGRRW